VFKNKRGKINMTGLKIFTGPLSGVTIRSCVFVRIRGLSARSGGTCPALTKMSAIPVAKASLMPSTVRLEMMRRRTELDGSVFT